MKVPLRFQITEYDCGTTSLINALSYLYEREEIPVSLLKMIYKYTLDVKGMTGVIGEGGTSRRALNKLARFIGQYAKQNDFDVTFNILRKGKVTEEAIRQCLKDGGCILARCYQTIEHYVLITNMDDNYAYLFDPYYLPCKHHQDKQVRIVLNQDLSYNRIVKIKRLFSQSRDDFSLMEINKREVVLINKKK